MSRFGPLWNASAPALKTSRAAQGVLLSGENSNLRGHGSFEYCEAAERPQGTKRDEPMTSGSAQVARLLPIESAPTPNASWSGGVLGGWIASMRPAQWAKNVFLFAGIAFAGK